MDWNRKQHLLNKYWAGETSLEEEQELRQLSAIIAKEDQEEEAAYFQVLEDFRSLESTGPLLSDVVEIQKMTKAPGRRIPFRFYWNVAAAVLLAIGFAWSIYQPIIPEKAQEIVLEDDPEKAFEFAKQSLLLMSSKLNEGASYTVEWSRFNTALEKIKEENRKK